MSKNFKSRPILTKVRKTMTPALSPSASLSGTMSVFCWAEALEKVRRVGLLGFRFYHTILSGKFGRHSSDPREQAISDLLENRILAVRCSNLLL
jgi:hypothetical protein